MKIIAECGATKSDWRLIDDGREISQVLVSGINVSAMCLDAVKAVIDDAFGQLGSGVNAVESIHLYVVKKIFGVCESLQDTLNVAYAFALVEEFIFFAFLHVDLFNFCNLVCKDI